jgi:maleylpyruvate isomerase
MAADISAHIAAVKESTAHLQRSISNLTNEQAREESLLPGWTRGHVLTHIARNADALINLTVWARTGIETPMYPSREVRNATIEAQSTRTAAQLIEDVNASSERFLEALTSIHGDQWDVIVRWGSADNHETASVIPILRRIEVEVHHVDLDLDYTLAHWPEDFVEMLIEDSVRRYTARGDVPGVTLVANDDEGSWAIGDGAQLVTGPPPALLGWLIGRTHGIGLHSDQPLPALGAWR